MSQGPKQPIPQGKYLPAVRHGDLVYTSGMTPRKAGKLLYAGKILTTDPIELHRDAVKLAALNALLAAQACLKEGEKIAVILQLSVFLNVEPDFSGHAKVADYASEFLIEQLGPVCIGSRATIGVAALPSGAPVEISLIASVT